MNGTANNGHLSKAEWIRGVLERYESPLIRYAACITGDLEQARDVVQDTFLKLCEREPDEIDSHLAEWLFTVCRHRSLDLLRKQSRMNPLTLEELEASPGPEPAPDKIIELREGTGHLLQLVAALPVRQRELLRLKFQQGLSYAEMARVTGLSSGNVGFLLHTAIQTLRQRMRRLEGLEHHPLHSHEN